jgi:hypothetical protein
MPTLTRRKSRHDDEQAHARVATPAIADAPRAAQILHLQRSVGNRAVAERLRIDRMPLTGAGSSVGEADKAATHRDLISGARKIGEFTSGVCYDTVAYMLYLDGRISKEQLGKHSGQEWLEVFAFDSRTQWTGGAIPAGAAVGFRRTAESPYKPGYFHAATGVGGTTIRAVNGNLLGQGWETADIAKVLTPTDKPGVYKHDGLPVSVYYW